MLVGTEQSLFLHHIHNRRDTVSLSSPLMPFSPWSRIRKGSLICDFTEYLLQLVLLSYSNLLKYFFSGLVIYGIIVTTITTSYALLGLATQIFYPFYSTLLVFSLDQDFMSLFACTSFFQTNVVQYNTSTNNFGLY